MTDLLQQINDALYSDLETFQAFLTDTLKATRMQNRYELLDGGTVTIREGWVDIQMADGRRLFGNLNTPREEPQEPVEPPTVMDLIFDHLFNGGDIQDLPPEHIKHLEATPNTILTRRDNNEAVRIQIGPSGVITATRTVNGIEERAGFWLPEGQIVAEDIIFRSSCIHRCMVHPPVPKRGRGR